MAWTERSVGGFAALLLCLPLAVGARAEAVTAGQAAWTVRPEWVKADEEFLASDALQGRGGATPDEAKAADWVATRFREFGLVPAPGMNGYLQTATIIQPIEAAPPVLTVAGRELPGLQLLTARASEVRGRLAVATSDDPAAFPAGDIVAAASPGAMSYAQNHKVKLLIVRQSAATDHIWQQMGGKTLLPAHLEGEAPGLIATAIAILPAAAFDSLTAQAGQEVALTPPRLTTEHRTTTNAIGFLPGTDLSAGVLLLSAHLDHLGRLPDGTIMHGADDDASGTTAVVELARALSHGPRNRRGILFVCYGAEEMGGFGSRYFGAHPPVPLSKIAANIEFEMIGAQDPKLPKGSLMMTGFERSNLGETLAAHGALVTGDPYPREHFFERSDNYSLALKGVVAHTLSGWAVTPVYHQPTDTIANLDIPFMTRAIQSLIEPVRWLAASDFQPQWKEGGQPAR